MSKKRRKKKQQEFKSTIGCIVDMSLEEFEAELVRQEANVGVMNNLKLNLSGVYNELVVRKDHIIQRVISGEIEKTPEIEKTLNGLYAEMIKVEQKAVYLTQKVNELLKLEKPSKGEVDSNKE